MRLRQILIGTVCVTPFVWGGAAEAQGVTQVLRITSEGAKAMINACEAYAEQHDMALAMWVVDQANTPIRFKRMVGANPVIASANRVATETGFGSTISSQMSGVATPITVDGQVLGAFVIGGEAPQRAAEVACTQAALAALKPGSSSERAASTATAPNSWLASARPGRRNAD